MRGGGGAEQIWCRSLTEVVVHDILRESQFVVQLVSGRPLASSKDAGNSDQYFGVADLLLTANASAHPQL